MSVHIITTNQRSTHGSRKDRPMISHALAFLAGGLTVYFWPQIKTKMMAVYDWAVGKI
jgi:hypothetical protein